MKKWQLLISHSFHKSYTKLDPTLKKQIRLFIETHQDGLINPSHLPNLKKLINSDGYYRLRFGKYRVGVFMNKEEKTFELALVQKRGDFYKHFPPKK